MRGGGSGEVDEEERVMRGGGAREAEAEAEAGEPAAIMFCPKGDLANGEEGPAE